MKTNLLLNKIIFCFVTILLVTNLINAQMCPVTPGSNLVTNGNFQSGCLTGFTSDYNYNGTCNGGTINPGQWTVTNDAASRNSPWFSNPTGPNPPGEPAGNLNHYLVIDADGVANKDAWNSSVNVINGATYFFSAWVSNINTNWENPPILKFSINNVQLGANINVSNSSRDWQQFYVTWTSTVTGSVAIRLENLVTTSNGNDFAIDAIDFNTSCANIPNLSSLGQSSVLPDTVYNCNVDFPYNLNPGLPGSYTLGWKLVPGAPIATTSTYNVPTTPASGTKYYLCYEYIAGCPRVDSVLFRTTPIVANLGSDKILCAPINYTLNSGITSTAATISWYKDNVLIPGATSSSYTALATGTYRVDVTRPGCTSGTSQMTITSPTSTISGSGVFCNASNTADFSVTGSTQVKWYTAATGGTAINSGDSNPTISLTPAATNTTTPGCSSGLYAEDISSYPGTLMPGTSLAQAPCGTPNVSGDNSNDGGCYLMVEVNQPVTLTSFDFVFPSGWSTSGTFTFRIYANNPTNGPWCSSCSPNGRYGVPTGAPLHTFTTANLSISATTIFTVTTSYSFTPGIYWLQLTSNSGQPFSRFNCSPAGGYVAGTSKWVNPYIDNTGNNAIRAVSGIQGGAVDGTGGNVAGSGNIFNIKFQVGNANTCQRLFICAVDNCTSPVEFLSFNVSSMDSGNYLEWKTGIEINSLYFNVERSPDGLNFEKIGIVNAIGNSDKESFYHFVDSNCPKDVGIVYYRLKEVDIDGSSQYSEIKSIGNDKTTEIYSIYPVPSKKGEYLFIKAFSSSEESIQTEIIDYLGRIVQTDKLKLSAGNNTLELKISSSVESGLYYVRILGTDNKTLKLIIE